MTLCKTQKEVKEVKRKRIHSEGSWMDDSGRKGQAMRERKVAEERNMRTCHIVPQFLFFLICHCSGLSLERREMELWGGLKRKSERCRI